MDIERLKEYILENDLIPTILTELDCHHIRHKDGYYTCGNPDGDNPSAITVYENDNLTTIDYTRDITNGHGGSDLISLVQYAKNESFPYAIKWICDVLDLEYYHDFDEELPQSLRLTKLLMEMSNTNLIENDEDPPLKPIDEKILSYYKNYVNDMFIEDGVSYLTQREFEVCYDEQSDRIIIPIRDDIGTLVGIKGRYFYRDVPDDEQKFLYLVKCARSQILYGLNRALPFIQQAKRVFVVEAEKGVMQCASAGFDETVATGGKKISKCQIDKLTRLCVPIYFVFDKDVKKEELEEIASKFINNVEIYAIIDTLGLLDDKESPTDNMEKFETLLEQCVYRLR